MIRPDEHHLAFRIRLLRLLKVASVTLGIGVILVFASIMLLVKYVNHNPTTVSKFIKNKIDHFDKFSLKKISIESNSWHGVSLVLENMSWYSKNSETANIPYSKIKIDIFNLSTSIVIDKAKLHFFAQTKNKPTTNPAQNNSQKYAEINMANSLEDSVKYLNSIAFLQSMQIKNTSISVKNKNNKIKLISNIDFYKKKSNVWKLHLDSREKNKKAILDAESYISKENQSVIKITAYDEIFISHYKNLNTTNTNTKIKKQKLDVKIIKQADEVQEMNLSWIIDEENKIISNVMSRYLFIKNENKHLFHIEHLNKNSYDFLSINANKNNASVNGYWQSADLAVFSKLANYFLNSNLSFVGQANDIQISIALNKESDNWVMYDFAVDSELKKIGYFFHNTTKSNSQIPRLNGISGRLKSNMLNTKITLSSKDFSFYLPAEYKNKIKFIKAKGEVDIKVHNGLTGFDLDTKNTRFIDKNKNIISPEIHWVFSNIAKAKKHSKIDIKIGVEKLLAKDTKVYFPSTILLDVGKFLSSSIKGGYFYNSSVKMEVETNKKFFVNATLRLQKGVLKIANLPKITNAIATITSDISSTNIDIKSAKIENVGIEKSKISISHKGKNRLKIDMKFKDKIHKLQNKKLYVGYLKNGKFIANSNILKDIKGDLNASLLLAINLAKAKKDFFIDTRIYSNNIKGNVGKNKVTGKLDISYATKRNLQINNLDLNINKQRVYFDKQKSTLDMKDLVLQLGLKKPKYKKSYEIKGNVSLNGKLTLKNNVLAIWLKPKIKNTLISLPIFRKDIGKEWNNYINIEVFLAENSKKLWKSYGNIEKFSWNLDSQNDALHGCINNKNTLSKNPTHIYKKISCVEDEHKTSNSGININLSVGDIMVANLISTMKLFMPESYSQSNNKTSIGIININAKRFYWASNFYTNNLNFVMQKKDDHTNINISAKGTHGQGKIKDKSIVLNFSSLQVLDGKSSNSNINKTKENKQPSNNTTKNTKSTLTPSSVGNIEVSIKNLMVVKEKFDSFYLNIHHNEHKKLDASVIFANLLAKGMHIELDGSWVRKNTQKKAINLSDFVIKGKFDNFVSSSGGKITDGTFNIFANWDASLFNFDPKLLNLNANLNLNNVFIGSAGFKFSKLLNAISVVNIAGISKVLKLSSESTSEQTLINKITTQVQIENGFLTHKSPTVMEGIGFTTTTTGNANIANGDIDMLATLKIETDNIVNFATLFILYPAAFSNPITAISSLFIANTLPNPFRKLTEFKYKIKGNYLTAKNPEDLLVDD
jgi:hypothetical protein